jgi:hypothetical protein
MTLASYDWDCMMSYNGLYETEFIVSRAIESVDMTGFEMSYTQKKCCVLSCAWMRSLMYSLPVF